MKHSPDGSHDAVPAEIPEPIWHGDPKKWKDNIQALVASGLLTKHMAENPPSQNSLAVATTVFYTAADYNTLFQAPLPVQIHVWAKVYDHVPWMTTDLAERSVRAYFSESTDGDMMPAHVVQYAKRIAGFAE